MTASKLGPSKEAVDSYERLIRYAMELHKCDVERATLLVMNAMRAVENNHENKARQHAIDEVNRRIERRKNSLYYKLLNYFGIN